MAMNSSNIPEETFSLRLDIFPLSLYLLVHGAVIFLTLVGNYVVVTTVVKDRLTQTPNNIFLCSLAVTDFLTGLTAVPAAMFARIVISRVTCLAGVRPFFFAPAFIFCAISMGHLIVLTVDRLIAVSSPLKYPLIMTKSKCKIILASIWILGFGFGTMPAIGGLKYPNQWVCGNVPYKSGTVALHSLLAAGFTPTISAILLCGYARIFMIAQRHLKEVSKRRRTGMDEEKVRNLESKSRMKATVTAVLVVLIFSICWLPMSIKLVIDVLYDPPEDVQFIYQTVVEFMAYCNSAINPILYALRNKKYRDSFKVALCICCPFVLKSEKKEKGGTSQVVSSKTTSISNTSSIRG
ncbi:putative histamine H2 receptor-like [Apostichopus japonicus]|uniref:Putative histamine H2 receptor-like n=1 Tax=Stichopus japonicus TaxID=307972 RepID=A0A2G8LEL0_STIJA|nr:putative histamine H2 receptor-like [Apostichopus japonicus]